MVARDATLLISLATEEFIRRFCQASQRVAEREKRQTVQHRDLATVVRKADEFLFLEEIIPWTSSDAPAKRAKPVKQAIKAAAGGSNTLDAFVVGKSASGGGVETANTASGAESAGAGSAADPPEAATAATPSTLVPGVVGPAGSDVAMTQDETMDQHDSD